MANRIIALAALLVLGAFLAVFIVRVPELDLLVVLGGCYLLAVVDFVLELRRPRTFGKPDPTRDSTVP